MTRKALVFLLWAGFVFAQEKPPDNPLAGRSNPPPPRWNPGASPIWDWTKAGNPLAGFSETVPPLFELRDFSGGLNLTAQPNAVAENEALGLNNFLFEIDGALKVRPGFSKVNSTPVSVKPIWGLYHYSLPNYGKGFLVGDSNYIYNMADAGTFADSQINIDENRGDFTSGSDVVNIDFPVGFWNIERRVCRGDKVVFGSTEYTIKQLYYDTTSSTYKLKLTANATATVSNQAFKIRASTPSTNPERASFVQRNNTVFFSMGQRTNGRWNGKLSDMVGIYANGTVDRVLYYTATTFHADTTVICRNCNFVTNELAGKILQFSTFTTDGSHTFLQHRIIASNTDTMIRYDRVTLDSAIRIGTPQPFLIFNPIFTVVDSGTIDSIYESSGGYIEMRDVKDFSDRWLYRGKIIEFLDGQARGMLEVTDGGRIGTLNGLLLIFNPSTDKIKNPRMDSTSFPKKGDRYAIYSLGAQAAIQELYYDRLVLAGIPNFPNTIRPSETGNPDSYASADVLTLPEQGGDSITVLKNFNGDLVAAQKFRLWKLIGPPPWTGATVILAADGIGCVASRSFVVSGNRAFFVGFNNGTPTVFGWDGGGVKFNTVGAPSVFGGGGPVSLTQKIDTLMRRVNKPYIGKATAGFYNNHLLVSLPFAPDTNNSATIAINLLTGAIAQETFLAGNMHNGRAAGDSSQLYFSGDSTGQVFLFGGATDNLDTGKTFRSSFQSKWFDFGNPTLIKQGVRWWAQYFRADSIGDTSRWVALTDFASTRQDSLVMNGSIGASTAERELNSYMKVGVLGKRLGFRFDSWGGRGNLRIDALRVQLLFRGFAP